MANNSYGNVVSDTAPTLVFASVGGSSQSPTTVAVNALAANGAAVYIGTDSSVATTTGFPLAAGETISLDLMGADAIWVVSAAEQNVRFICLHK